MEFKLLLVAYLLSAYLTFIAGTTPKTGILPSVVVTKVM
jgi:hypothetical protein